MTSESQRRANRNYRKRVTESGVLKRISLEFYEPEHDLYEFAKENKPTATYIKNLIRKDMEGKK